MCLLELIVMYCIQQCVHVCLCNRAVHHGQKCLALQLVTAVLDYLKPEQ